jgi:hypothetical protein
VPESKLDREMIKELVDRWSTLTREQEEAESTVPVLVLTAEAVDLAQILDDYFVPRSDDNGELPGLESVVATGQLSPALAGELREIALALGRVQRNYETLLKKADNAPIERADRLMQELRALLAFILEDGQHEEGALKLAKLRELYSDEQSHDGVAMMLEAYADLATTVEEELKQIDGFDAAILDECMQIGADLRQRSANKLSGVEVQEQRTERRRRDRLVGALMQRLQTGRRCFRFVFRDHPDVAAKAGSSYERDRRRNRRHRKEQEAAATPPAISGLEETQVPAAATE